MDIFCKRIGKQFLAVVVSAGSISTRNTLCVKPYQKWQLQNLCGVFCKDNYAVDDIIDVCFQDNHWVAGKKAGVMLDGRAEWLEKRPVIVSQGQLVVHQTKYCTSCGQNISYD